jgi:DinB superfamily
MSNRHMGRWEAAHEFTRRTIARNGLAVDCRAMQVAELLLESLRQARVYLEARMDVCGEDVLYRRLPGSSLQSIGAIYAHAVVTEDSYVRRALQGSEPLFESSEWRARAALPPKVELNPGWAEAFAPDPRALRDYARAVYANTDDHLSRISDDALTRTIREYMAAYEDRAVIRQRDVTVAFHFMDNVILHTVEHAAEMSALLGVQDLKSNAWE